VRNLKVTHEQTPDTLSLIYRSSKIAEPGARGEGRRASDAGSQRGDAQRRAIARIPSVEETPSARGSNRRAQPSDERFDELANRYGTARTVRRARKDREPKPMRKGAIAAVVSAIVLVVLVAAFAILYYSNVFAVTSIEVEGNRYVSTAQVLEEAGISSDATLLRLDAGSVTARIESNPWIESVNVKRVFPSTVVLSVTETNVAAVAEVDSSSPVEGSSYWLVSSQGTWIEQLDTARAVAMFGTNEVSSIDSTGTSQESAAAASASTTTSGTGQDTESDQGNTGTSNADETQTGNTQTEETAQTEDAATVTDTGAGRVTATLSGSTSTSTSASTASATAASTALPFADASITSEEIAALPLVEDLTVGIAPAKGGAVSDAGLLNAIDMLKSLTSDFAASVKTIKAPSAETTTFVLDNGVEVAFGAAVDVEQKEAIINELIAEHEGAISYINVRIVSRPSWRGVS